MALEFFNILLNHSRSGGYDYQFVDEPSDDLKCLICLCVARDPQQHGDGGCGKIFCTSCIDKHKRTNDKCPNCRKVMNTFKDERSKWMFSKLYYYNRHMEQYTMRIEIEYMCTLRKRHGHKL